MQRLISVLTSGPVNPMITMQAARDDMLRRDGADADSRIDLLISAAMSKLDGTGGILSRALITQTWSDVMDGFPVGSRLPLILAPVQSLESVTYFDAVNMEQSLSADEVTLHEDAGGAYLRRANNSAWPSTYDRDDAVRVSYVAGYGDMAADVPGEIRLAALDMIYHAYHCPGSEMPPKLTRGLQKFKRPIF